MKLAALHLVLLAYAAMAAVPAHEQPELDKRALQAGSLVVKLPAKQPYNTKRPGSTGTFKPPANPTVLPLSALVQYLGAASVEGDSQLASLAASLNQPSNVISLAPVVTPVTSLLSGVTAKLGLRERAEQDLEVKEKRGLLLSAIVNIITQAFPPPAASTTTPAAAVTTSKKTTTSTTTTTSKASSTSTTSSFAVTTTPKASMTPSVSTSSTTSKSASTTTSSTTTIPSTTSTSSTTSSMISSSSSSSAVSVSSSVATSSSVVVSTSTVATTTTSATPSASASAITCLDSSADDSLITSLFYYGGDNTTVTLCEGANIQLSNAIFFFGQYQTLTTANAPTGSTRATITVTGQNQTCAIYGAAQGNDYALVSNIQINGNRPAMGRYDGDDALANIEMGGNNYGQQVSNTWSYEPRGWSALHMIEGSDLYCSGSIVTNNQLGPSGQAPSPGQPQFSRRMKRMLKRSRANKRDDSGTYGPGEWADGISMACRNSYVSGNTITDATDGAIVLFGAPGTVIENNHIISETRHCLGGINGVDYNPHDGAYTGSIVRNNIIDARNAMIKTGIALGPLTWGVYSDPDSDYYNYDGTWQNNVFTTTGTTGYFNFGITISGFKNPTVLGNTFQNANFGGDTDSGSCLPGLPDFGPMYWANQTVTGATLQVDMVQSTMFELTICAEPGNITVSGYSSSA